MATPAKKMEAKLKELLAEEWKSIMRAKANAATRGGDFVSNTPDFEGVSFSSDELDKAAVAHARDEGEATFDAFGLNGSTQENREKKQGDADDISKYSRKGGAAKTS
ncbi:hypothetical protein [Endothiovibrio diazotrophicus]